MDLSWGETKKDGFESQGSEDWLTWRRQGIGSSDAPVLMGVSPWQTLYGLYMDKVEGVNSFTGNWVTERGKRLEGFARDQYETLRGIKAPPKTISDNEYPWMRASLDGFCEKTQRLVEIKCPIGKDRHATEVPEKYWPQVQWQLMVSRREKLDFVIFGETEIIRIIEVVADPFYQDALREKALWFWNEHIQKRIPPECDEEKIEDAIFEAKVSEYHELGQHIGVLDKVRKQMGAIIGERLNKGTTLVGSYSVKILEVKGRVQYDEIPELEGVDLEKYRGGSTKQIRVYHKEGE